MHVGIATDHGGFGLKEDLVARLREAGHDVVDFGTDKLNPDDDYPDFVIPLARAVAAGTVERDDEVRIVVIRVQRSEEHTSELQSRLHLVCRLLLEKKNQTS